MASVVRTGPKGWCTYRASNGITLTVVMLVDGCHILESSPTVDGTASGGKKIKSTELLAPDAGGYHCRRSVTQWINNVIAIATYFTTAVSNLY